MAINFNRRPPRPTTERDLFDYRLCFVLGLYIERRGNRWTTWTIE